MVTARPTPPQKRGSTLALRPPLEHPVDTQGSPHRCFGKELDRDAADRGLTSVERRYLGHLFDLLDWGVVLRVRSTQTRLQSNSMEACMQSDRGYTTLLTSMDQLAPPHHLTVMHRWLIDALTLHRDFFDAWDASGDTPDIPSSPLVRDASDKLRAVSAALVSSFPGVSSHNRRAFFDHLSALDFV